MARTTRRGTASRNQHHYIGLGVIWGECDCYTLSYPLWKDGSDDPRSYKEYVGEEVRRYHQDKRQRGLPRYVRHQDVSRQKREHQRLIHSAVRSGDYDVALSDMAQRASWAYW